MSPPEYLKLYNEILDKLDPRKVVSDLEALGQNPTILCWESGKDIDAGFKWCHRSVAAQWLEDTIGIKVAEVNWPALKRFAFLRSQHMQPPSYEPRSPENLMDVLAEKS